MNQTTNVALDKTTNVTVNKEQTNNCKYGAGLIFGGRTRLTKRGLVQEQIENNLAANLAENQTTNLAANLAENQTANLVANLEEGQYWHRKRSTIDGKILSEQIDNNLAANQQIQLLI